VTRPIVAASCLLLALAAPRAAGAAGEGVEITCSVDQGKCGFMNWSDDPANACLRVRVLGEEIVSDEVCSGTLDPGEARTKPLTFSGAQPRCRGANGITGCHLLFEDQHVSFQPAERYLAYAKGIIIFAVILGSITSLHYWQRRTRKLLDKRRGR